MPDTKPNTDQPDRLDGQSLDLLDQRLAAIKALLPEAFDLDGNLVRDKLIEALKPATYETISEMDDIPSFGLAWPGKQRAFAAAGVPTTATLRPCPDQSIDFDTTQNLLIEGDNLEVLKTLQRGYHGKVKMIYIDPPYNTGSDFVYPDNYGEGLDTYLQRTQQKDEDGFWKSTNSETSGRKHANWLSMMAPRLALARNLLRADGAIAVSIDDHELHNIRMLLDETFGPENFVGCISRATGTTTGQDAGKIGSSLDYALVYQKSHEFVLMGLPLDEDDQARFTEEDKRGKYSILQLRKTGNADRREDRPSMYYPVTAPDGTEVLPVGPGGYESRWRFGPDNYQEHVDKDMIVWKNNREGVLTPYVKYYLEGRTKQVSNLWTDIDGNKKGTIELRSLMGPKSFDNPKPTAFIRQLIQVLSEPGDISLDFFAGSGTTGHAVMAQNAEDGGNRRYICVQLPEPLDKPVTLDDGVVCETIFDLTRERLKRAGKKIKEEAGLNAEKLDTGLRVFKLASSNFTAWNSEPTSEQGELYDRLEQLTEQTVPGRSETDILWEVLLKMGLPLDLQLERFELEGAPGVTFIGVNDRTRVMSTETSIPTAAMEALLDQDIPPSELVVLDSAFEDDTARANIATLYKERKDEDGRPVCNLRVV